MNKFYFSKFYFTCVLLILCCIKVLAQPAAIKDVRPLAPNAAALFKLADRPIGSFTGTTPVSFPLSTVTSGPLAINLSLDYSTSGVRVEEVAGCAGLGFSFNDGGGRIVQMVNGKPDDLTGGMLDPAQTIKPSNFNNTNGSHMMSAYANNLDLEPDVFLYNFAGKSGRFIFKDDGTIINKNDSGLKIERVYGGFKITDENGSEYYFTTRSKNTYSYNNGSSWLPTTIESGTWYLTDIYDMNHENRIKFTYVSSGGSFFGFSSGHIMLGSSTCVDIQSSSAYAVSYVNTNTTELVLDKIEGRSGYIICNTSNDRTDMTSARKINSLDVYDSTAVLKKKFKFNYNYSESGSNGRLKLKSFAEFGSGLSDSLLYRFDYYDDVILPSYNSNAVDFWGYYNGKTNNSSHFSDVIYGSGNQIIRQNLWNEVDRTPNVSFAKAQTLAKITYPTGGYRQFIYESNTISQYVNFNEFVPDPDVANVQTFSLTNIINQPKVQKFFTVNSTYGGAYFKLLIAGNSTNYNIRVYKANPGTTSGGIEVLPQKFNNVFKFDLPNDNYRLDVNNSSFNIAQVSATWSECTVASGSYYNKEVGGIRVKEIKDYDPISNKTSTTQYRYMKYSSDSTKSSGRLVMPLQLIGYDYAAPLCSYRRINATGNYPLTTEGSSYVVYPEVRTKEDGNGWSDRTYTYSSDLPGTGYPVTPITNMGGYRGRLESEKIYNQNGTLLKRTVLAYLGVTTEPGQLGIRWRAIFGIDDPATGEKSTFYPRPPAYVLPNRALFSTWTEKAGRLAIRYSIDSVFSATGVNVSRTDYTYESHDNYILPKQVKTTSSNGTKEVNYRYASTSNTEFFFGLTTDEQAIKTMLFNKNYLQPLEITNTITPSGGATNLVNGRKVIFNIFNNTKFHLSSLKEYSSSSDFRETYISLYDNIGNIREKYIYPGIKEVYLWGYKGQYPVAKILGSDYATVGSIISQSQIDGATSTPNNDQALRSLLSNLRSNIPNSQVWTYTYNPLVGMTSETDPKGKVTHYEYDDFQRLKHVKDQNGNILRTNTYNYKP